MGLQVVKLLEPEWFTPAHLVESDEPFRVKLRGLNGIEQAEISPDIIVTDSLEVRFSARALRYLIRNICTDFEGLFDGDQAVDTSKLQASEIQALLPIDIQTAIARRIFELTNVSESDKKK